MAGIGLLNEKPLHAALKDWCVQPGDRVEVPLDGYVIDIVRQDLLLEIQTRNFAAIKAKLIHLARDHRLRLIYPIAQEKWIVKLPLEAGAPVLRRKSPRRGRVEDLFWELVRFPQLMTQENVALEVLLIQEEEVRRFDETRHWRRRGWGTEERRLLAVVERRLFAQPADWRALLPAGLAQPFTTQTLADAAGMRRPLAQKMAYCLRHMGVIEPAGKEGRARCYVVRADGDAYAP